MDLSQLAFQTPNAMELLGVAQLEIGQGCVVLVESDH